MKIAVLSGKGGVGKTLVSVNLAAAAEKAVYIDCDVEEPNGRLFLKPEKIEEKEVTTGVPQFDEKKCTGCRACVDFCRFHALVYIKEKPKLFSEVCHACGGCSMVCPTGAVTEMRRGIGKVETGVHNQMKVITGELNLGEASGVSVIQEALKEGEKEGEGLPVIVDCPPGSACPVVESIADADYCLLVTEPTAFGFHNFCMVHELVSLFGKPCGVVINKCEAEYEPLKTYCKEKNLPVLLELPYKKETAAMISEGKILCEQSQEYREQFQGLLNRLGGEVS